MTILILVDWKLSKDSNVWLKTELEQKGYQVKLLGIPDYNIKDRTTRLGHIRLWYKYLSLAISAIKHSGKYDVLISLNFVVGSWIGLICRLLNFKRKIISLNLIAHEKGLYNSLFRRLIYNYAFGYKMFWFSVNDDQLIDYYSSLFKFPGDRIFILHDVFGNTDEQADYKELDTYVFTGGEAFRDWTNVIRCAQEMPNIQFVGVGRQKAFSFKEDLPGNLKLYFDISQNEFYLLLKESAIVFIPLLSMAPCGLIVLMRAGLLSKPVIATNTPSIRNYIKHDITGLLVEMSNFEQMKNSIERLFNSKILRKNLAENLRRHLVENFSHEHYTQKIEEIIVANGPSL